MKGPRARRSGVEAQQLGAELLLYDVESDRAICLRPAAALVWQLADGTRSAAQLAALLGARLEVEDGAPWVAAALDELERAGLLESRGPASPTLSRRAVLRRLGAAVATPLVFTVLAPTPAMAASAGAPCSSDMDCNSGKCAGANKNRPGVCR